MNFNIYIDKQTGKLLERLAKSRRIPRNALIREALARAVEQGGGGPRGRRRCSTFVVIRRAIRSSRRAADLLRPARIRSLELSSRHLRAERFRTR